VTAASVSAGTDVFRYCDLNNLSRTAVESKSNRSCNDYQQVSDSSLALCDERCIFTDSPPVANWVTNIVQKL